MMQNLSFHNTEGRTDYTHGGIKQKSSDRPPVDSAISKSAILIEIFQTVLPFIPPRNTFPLVVQDGRMRSRAEEILGLPQDQKTKWGHGAPYAVFGKEVYKWLQTFEAIIGKPHIEAEYIVGSAAVYIAGQPLLREALDVFFRNIPDHHPEKFKLFVKLIGKIAQKTFSFADVDLRIKVKPEVDLGLIQKQINQIDGCRTEVFNGKVLIIYIEDEHGKALDIVVYKELDTESAFNLDDFKVDICHSQLEKNIVAFESVDPWKLWFGQTLGVLEDYTTDKFRSMPRLLWQLSKSKISIVPTESNLFPRWIRKINDKLITDRKALCTQFNKQQANHDRHVPIANCLLRLRAQQLIRDFSPDSRLALREAANDEIAESIPSFLKALFRLMNEKGTDIAAVHSLIECIALLALYEGWQKPFEVKLVKHEGKWVQRIRFRGTFGKRDLLVRFDIAKSWHVINGLAKEPWEKMRVIIHSLWFDGIGQRSMSNAYRKTVPFQSSDIANIRNKFLSETGIKKEVAVAMLPPLAQLEISWSENSKFLLEVGKIVFHHYYFDLATRNQLCWKIVFKCIDNRGYHQAAEMVKMLRDAGEDYPEGYASLFSYAIQKSGESYALYQACSPFPPIPEDKWMELALSKDKVRCVFELMNEIDISAELFLEMVQLLKVKKPIFGEKILCKLAARDRRKASQWIMEKDNPSFISPEYTTLVSACISENKNGFDPFWLKEYILSKRFAGTPEEKNSICRHLLSKPIILQEKVALLQSFEIKDATLWQIVANEYISQGECWPDKYNADAGLDYESLVLWHQIIERADDKAFVEKTLEKIKPPPASVKDTIRGLVLVRLLKNWEQKKVDIEILRKLDLSKKPIAWETVLDEAKTGEDILKALNGVSLPLYSALLRTIKPKEPFYAAFWVKMMQQAFPEAKTAELFAALKSTVMTDCLQVNPQLSLPLYKRIGTTQDGIQFILETLDEVDESLLYMMLKACVNFNDHCATGAKVVMKFYESKKFAKTPELTRHLGIIAKSVLMDPHGDTEAVLKIWKVIKKEANPDQLPCKEQFIRLIQNNCVDWIIEMLNSASEKDLEKLPSDVYCRIINACKDVEKRCVIIERCTFFSEALQNKWVVLAQSEGLDVFSAARLLRSASKLHAPDSKVQKCALFVLSNISTHQIEMDNQVLKYLLEMTSRIEIDDAYKLWDGLNKLRKIEKKELYQTALALLYRNPMLPHYALLNWVIQNTTDQASDELLSLMKEINQFSLEDRIKILIMKWAKREALKNNLDAKTIYWDLDCDENISLQDIEILNPNQNQRLNICTRLIEKGKKEKLSAPISRIFTHLCCMDEKILKYALEKFAKDPIDELFSTKIALQAHHYPHLIPLFHSAIDQIRNPSKKIYLNGLLLSATLIEKPSQKIAINFIEHLESIWRDLNKDLWKEELDDWKEMEPFFYKPIDMHESHLVPNSIFNLFCAFINNNFIRSQENIYFDPEVLHNFLRMLKNCGNNLSFLQISLLQMLVGSLRKKFNAEAAHTILKFIFIDVPIFKDGNHFTQNGKPISLNENDARFFNRLLLQAAALITKEHPSLGEWGTVCIKHLMIFSKYANGSKLLLHESYSAYVALRGTINGFNHPKIECADVAITKAIQQLSETEHPEHHRRILMILLESIPDILIHNPERLKESNLAYIQSVLKTISEHDLYLYLSHLFVHLCDSDSMTDCFTNRNEPLQLELIHTNVSTIINRKPYMLPKVIDYLNAHILSRLSPAYRRYPEHFQKLLSFLISECNKVHTDRSANWVISFEKLIILIRSHPYISNELLIDIEANELINERVKFSINYQRSLCEIGSDREKLLELKPEKLIPIDPTCPLRDVFKLELTTRNQWCQVTTEVFTQSDFNYDSAEEKWLQSIKEEFIRSLCIAHHLPSYGSLTINLLSSVEKVMQLIKMLSKTNPEFANYWLATFINNLGMESKTLSGQWYMILLLQKIGKNMCKELLPCLELIEQFPKQFSPMAIEHCYIELYLALIENGCHDHRGIVDKAVTYCSALSQKVRFKPENNRDIYGPGCIYTEPALDFIEKFELIYLVGFENLLSTHEENIKAEQNSKLATGLSNKLLVNAIKRFRSLTDATLFQCHGKNRMLPKALIIKIKEELNLLKDIEVFREIMELLMDLRKIAPVNPVADLTEMAEMQTTFLLFALFHGPKENQRDDNYLVYLNKKYLEEVANLNVFHYDYTEYVRLTMKWLILEDPSRPTLFGNNVKIRGSQDPIFRDLVFSALDDVCTFLDECKKFRPQFKSWYDIWCRNAENILIQIDKGLLKNKSSPHGKVKMIKKIE